MVAAMRFSLAFFLEAEGWYRVGDSFMKGTFLQGEKNSLARISFDPLCSSVGVICFKISVDFVSLRFMEPWMYKSPGKAPLLQQSVSCLPKLGCGRIIAMHRSLPPTAPFGTYKDMRDYWKISYGYDLPKAQPEAYYDVYFNGSLRPFLYPYFCVLAEKPVPIIYRESRERAEAAVEDFAAALDASMKTVCGEGTKFHERCGEEARMISILARTAPVSKRRLQVPIREKRPSLMQEMMKNEFVSRMPPPSVDGVETPCRRLAQSPISVDNESPKKNRMLGARVMTGKSLFAAETAFRRPFPQHFKTPTKSPGDRPSPAGPLKRPLNSVSEVPSKRFRRPVVDVE